MVTSAKKMATKLFNPIKAALAKYNTLSWIAIGILVLAAVGAIWKVPILSDVWRYLAITGVGLAATAGFGGVITAGCCLPIVLFIFIGWLLLKPTHPPEPIRKWHPRFKRR